MSRTSNGGIRCDWCGRITRNRDAAYTQPDGGTGYINQPEWMRFPGGDPTEPNIPTELDICEECAEDRCPACGSGSIVSLTPSVPGPSGWGYRCKACQFEWSLPEMPERNT